MVVRIVEPPLFQTCDGKVVPSDKAIVLGHFGRATPIGKILAFLSPRAKTACVGECVAHSYNSF